MRIKRTFPLLFLSLLMGACSRVPTQIPVSPSASSTVVFLQPGTPQPLRSPTLLIPPTSFTPTNSVTPTTPVRRKTPTIPKTHRAPSSTETTAAAGETVCDPPTRDYDSALSPDGRWQAVVCRGQYGVADSYLYVESIQGDKQWRIHHADYVKAGEDDTDGMIYPFHWSADGKSLYATSPSAMSGCCWIGYDLLLVRLDLENGRQTEIANYISDGSGLPGVDFSISPGDHYALYVPPDGSNTLYMLDLRTGAQRTIKLKFENTGAGFVRLSNDEQKVILVLREYPPQPQGDLTFGSLLLIDLSTGSQGKILAGIDYNEMLFPVEWRDAGHVLLEKDGDYFLLDIHSGERTAAEK